MPAELETGKLASCRAALRPTPYAAMRRAGARLQAGRTLARESHRTLWRAVDSVLGAGQGTTPARGALRMRIDHWVAFSHDAACTNQAESFFSRLRRAEFGQHHHISGVYVAFCAACAHDRWGRARIR